MKTSTALVLVSIAFILLAGRSLALLLHFEPLCGEEAIASERSSDGKYVAQSFERNCGATAPFVEHVNLRAASARLSPGFFDGTIKESEVFTSADAKITVEWKNPRLLVIHHGMGRRSSCEEAWRDVRIECDPPITNPK